MDARKHDRARFIYRLRVHGAGPGAEFKGHLLDVTPEGMMLISNQRFGNDDPLSLTIQLPRNTMGGGHMTFDASVRWCEPRSADDRYYLGVSLDRVPAASRYSLKILMDRFQELPIEDGHLDDEDPYVQEKGIENLSP